MILSIFGSPVVVLSTNNSRELFPEIIYNEIVGYLLNPNNKFTSDLDSVRGGNAYTTGLSSTININSITELDSLLLLLKQYGLDYSHLYTNNSIKDLDLHNSTVNLYFYGSEVKNHCDKRHSKSKQSLTVLFYPKVPAGSSALVFMHNSEPNDWVSDYNENNLVRLNVEEGTIVIFDNSILHAVGIHNTIEPRMSIHIEFDFVFN
jgi:hypothetical protein